MATTASKSYIGPKGRKGMVRDIEVAPSSTATRDPAADALPEDLVMKDGPKRDKPKRRQPRIKRHGRSR